MTLFVNILAGLFLVGGSFFFLVGVLGLLRMPDIFSRIHTTTKGDTLGIGLILFGLILLSGWNVASLKLLIILILVWLTTPTAAHLIAKAAHERMDQ